MEHILGERSASQQLGGRHSVFLLLSASIMGMIWFVCDKARLTQALLELSNHTRTMYNGYMRKWAIACRQGHGMRYVSSTSVGITLQQRT